MSIPDELRREARRPLPFVNRLGYGAWDYFAQYIDWREWVNEIDPEHLRTMLLLVACAVESEE